ncbi:NUDIX hydrolase [Deinococcus yavapaiensis]|uniref:8-oxo-dGTP diphosphatase n=1 Tax=Deinococcus yavapaiensis KR-236 TaxID=694435 RepID=A0A318S6Y7_9DEIO|nr:NUDIX domain-containing protein [Deinococcus yavapaiensis]PYE53525.1 8-oxo-dGTP diphosphatase [Deinococcus yavapaiensis KR-236]
MTRSPDEQAFLDAYDPTAFERPSVTVDVVLLTVLDGDLHVLLIRRDEHPCKGCWSLPGGFIRMTESLDEAAARVLNDKAHLQGVYAEQLYTFGAPRRDPRTRVLSVAYVALVNAARLRPVEDDRIRLALLHVDWQGETGGPASASWHGQLLALAFDHADILGLAVKRLRGKLDYAPVGFELLPERFTLRDLQSVHETILGRKLNKDSFRRRMLASGRLSAVGEREEDADHRPAALYTFERSA